MRRSEFLIPSRVSHRTFFFFFDGGLDGEGWLVCCVDWD